MRLARTKDAAGRFLLDVAKLVIGGVILAGIMEQDIPHHKLFIIGGITIVGLLIGGFSFVILTDKENKED
jgi:hypothetical protein